VSVERERDRDMRRDDQRVVEEIRRLFERYRATARRATEPAEDVRPVESPDDAPALTLR
jgi:hypothetical protein